MIKFGTRSLLSLVMMFAAVSVVEAQMQGDVVVAVRKVELKKQMTPQYQLSKNQMSGKQREWVEIVTEYDTDAQWTDELTFTYYVLMQGKAIGAPKQSLFRAKQTFVNIEKGRSHKSSMFIHPSTLARFGTIERVAVLVEANGKLLAGDALPKTNQRWWEQMSPTDGMIMNRSQTPFAMINFDDYEPVKAASP